eukprot:NODE_25_length_35605_cov_0.353461.p19 type:complete len:119 gc:universal NODE_25_length_35605_cov_0.353461:8572-8216(-)
MLSFDKLISDVLTAKDSSIGNSGGTHDVTIIMQFKNNLYLSRLGSKLPTFHTCTAAVIANINKNPINANASKELALTGSLLNTITLTNSPWVVLNPVCSTIAIAPLSGGLGMLQSTSS